ncbi:hypothetical protein RB9481 [Rhodopirellula baltica SH 1]|uniref:Uncharacterized protein n=1 Tax=Rhodopirellula baltica (strain DSM 10527 / NCIMB 13988 / SH1) TaxID=243090 RepID=Q7ULI8_RHOBA|nr:hypothetical protein RB9481 [Rhodopirellula baltica SH 1]
MFSRTEAFGSDIDAVLMRFQQKKRTIGVLNDTGFCSVARWLTPMLAGSARRSRAG